MYGHRDILLFTGAQTKMAYLGLWCEPIKKIAYFLNDIFLIFQQSALTTDGELRTCIDPLW